MSEQIIRSVNVRLLFLSVLVMLIQGCSRGGACEYYYTYDSSNRYYCSNDSISDDLSDAKICSYRTENTFHDGFSCEDIGYDKEAFNNIFQYNAHQHPSPHGAYANGGTLQNYYFNGYVPFKCCDSDSHK